jgi:Leucine-rich repeat (LRR) protein
MAELLLIATVEPALDTAKEIITRLWGFEDEVQRLKNTVSKIKDLLLDAGEKQAAGNPVVTLWLRCMENTMYDADDLLDAISTDALRREIITLDKKAKQVRIFFSKSNQLAFRLKMGHKIEAMRESLDAIAADGERFQLEVVPVETRLEKRKTHPFVRAETVIGREDDKKAVIHRLLDSNVEENVSILPIVGFGGLGKTTLAQLVYNDEQILRHFDLKMWVHVSDIFDVKNIVRRILESTAMRITETSEMDTLIGFLKEEIDGKKYFLVLDDVWNEDCEKWSRLQELLMGGARGSRILVTTRYESVARTIRYESVARIIGTVQSHNLKGLDAYASWSLFKRMAFRDGQEPMNTSIIALGREIQEKCSGVPLAIRTIGSLLYFRSSEADWLSFKNNVLSKISQTEDDFLSTLKLSYDQLPSHLKQCFAYCSLFPKDYKIDRSTLIKLWIAQGFVKLSNQNRFLEEVGDEYFMHLLLRSFFQEAEMDEFGNIIRCKIHYLMHDLAKSVAGSLIATLGDEETNIDERTRHVSFVGDYVAIFSSISTSFCKASRLRTFLCLHDQDFEGKIDYDALFSSFKFLRLLDLHRRGLGFVPSSISKLKHLRYLDLSENNIKKLPNSITRLQNLQTLKLSNCVSLKELPRDIKKLVNLRHLEIDKCHALTYMPRGLGQLANLQTLSTFVVHSGSHSKHISGLQELNGLNNLRGELVIRNLGHGKGESEYKAAYLKEKQHLHALYLWWSDEGSVNVSDVEDEMSLEGFQPHPNLKQLRLRCYPGSRHPSWLSSLTSLVRFRLESCRKCQYLPPLSQLPSLKYLDLYEMDAMEYILDTGDSNEFSSSSAPILLFPSLKQISLFCCPNLKGWWRRDSSVEVNRDGPNSIEIVEHRLLPSFSCLSTLSIFDCPMLTSMPMFPHLEEELVLEDASSKPLQQTMMMDMPAPQSPTSTATTSSSFTPLSKLKCLILRSITDLETLPLQNLTSLESLVISNCHRLKSLSPGIQHLIALKYLDLEFCLELELAKDEDGTQWQGLTSLLSLRFSRLPKLVSLPSGLRHAATLQMLEISDCESLTAIPEWIHNCKSLQVIEICQCLGLASLPEGMHRLTSLQRLTIKGCPILLQRCKGDTGEDWPKIAHIPKLDLQ